MGEKEEQKTTIEHWELCSCGGQGEEGKWSGVERKPLWHEMKEDG
jgi:hypothetical protein